MQLLHTSKSSTTTKETLILNLVSLPHIQVILSYMNENNANREEEDPLQICDLLE